MTQASQKSSLDGINFKPFSLMPSSYDLMIYPSEWIFEGLIPDSAVRQLSKYFYNRFFGRHRILCFQTLYYKTSLKPFFEKEDPEFCIEKIIESTDPVYKIFYSDSLNDLRNGKLKEITKLNLPTIGDYIADPLIPAEIERVKAYKMTIGTPMNNNELIDFVKKVKGE